jgi:tripartite-type tricarboxylate transporter receptor subunit TctC
MRYMMQAVALALWLSCNAVGVALAQTYPAKPLRMIVPFPPGGAADLIGRVVAQRL